MLDAPVGNIEHGVVLLLNLRIQNGMNWLVLLTSLGFNPKQCYAILSRVHELAEFSVIETRFEIGNLAAYIQLAYALWFTNRKI